MSNPKFAVGERVAVCTTPLNVVIPKTKVVEVTFSPKMQLVNMGGKVALNVWNYRVADHSSWFAEWTLRPIFPGEYDESNQDQALPVEVDA